MFLQETTDYARPIVFAVQVGLQDLDQGPVLDDSWPTVARTEVRQVLQRFQSSDLVKTHESLLLLAEVCLFDQLPFWNGCDEDDRCIPDLALQSMTDLMTRR